MNALEQVARGLAGSMVGDPERWVELLQVRDEALDDDTEPDSGEST